MPNSTRVIDGKIILIDDQNYEKDLLVHSLKELGWEIDLIYYHSALDALEYLKTTKDTIFIIISDMNMPKMTGMEFKQAIDADRSLDKWAIPFIFSTTTVRPEQLIQAYEYRVQGYFEKPTKIEDVVKQYDIIFQYWFFCWRPDSIKGQH